MIKPILTVVQPFDASKSARLEHNIRCILQRFDASVGAIPFGRRLALREPAFDRSNRKEVA